MQKLRLTAIGFLFLCLCSVTQAQDDNALIEQAILEDLQENVDSTQNDSIICHNPQKEPAYCIDTLGAYQVPFVDSLICFAESLLGRPYKYGSKGPDSFDCSGFTGYVFSHFGIKLPSSSTYQYKEAPEQFSDFNNVRQGDLIFFMGRNGRKSVGHVGIVVDIDTATKTCRFIHAATHGGVIETNYPSSSYYNQRFMDYGRYALPDYIWYYETKKCYLSDSESTNKETTSEGE